MSTDLERVYKIAKVIEANTKLKDKDKILEMANKVDEFTKLILQGFLTSKGRVSK